MALIENNRHSLELLLVRLVRRVRRGNSSLVRTSGGLEFHTSEPGEAPVTRYADVPYLVNELARNGVRTTARLAATFWDTNRFPAGAARGLACAFNALWFGLRFPHGPASGTVLIGEKV